MPKMPLWVTVWRSDDVPAMVRQNRVTKQAAFILENSFAVTFNIAPDGTLFTDDPATAVHPGVVTTDKGET